MSELQRRDLAVVTGSASGIGSAVAGAIMAAGSDVVGLDLKTDSEDDGTYLSAHVCDVTDEAAVAVTAQRIQHEHGTVSSLVHCAGWSPHGDFLESSSAENARIVSVNYLGLLNVVKAFAPGMVEAGHGRIVIIASDAARTGVRGEAVYAGTKAAQIAFAKSLAVELARTGITVNVVSPGTTDTSLLRRMLSEDQIERRRHANPMRRIGTPTDVATAAEFFTRTDVSYITGQVLSVNGGLTRVD